MASISRNHRLPLGTEDGLPLTATTNLDLWFHNFKEMNSTKNLNFLRSGFSLVRSINENTVLQTN